MKFREMLDALRIKTQSVEIRDKDGNTVCATSVFSKGILPYLGFDVTEWFPGAGAFQNVDFTVYLDM